MEWVTSSVSKVCISKYCTSVTTSAKPSSELLWLSATSTGTSNNDETVTYELQDYHHLVGLWWVRRFKISITRPVWILIVRDWTYTGCFIRVSSEAGERKPDYYAIWAWLLQRASLQLDWINTLPGHSYVL